jgi:hypothetical protein
MEAVTDGINEAVNCAWRAHSVRNYYIVLA